MNEDRISVPSINCPHCTQTIEREVSTIAGVDTVHADVATKTVSLRWSDPATWEQIAARLSEIGHPPAP